MTKGKRPSAAPPSPSGRWALLLGALVAIGLVAWWLASRSGEGEAGEPVPVEEAGAPQPLGNAGPTVEAAASIENVPPDSLVSAGPDAPSGVDVSNDPRLGAASAPVTIVASESSTVQ